MLRSGIVFVALVAVVVAGSVLVPGPGGDGVEEAQGDPGRPRVARC